MIRVGNFPESQVGIAGVDETRVMQSNIAVNLAMDVDTDKDDKESPRNRLPRRMKARRQVRAEICFGSVAYGGDGRIGIRCTGMEEISRQIVNMKFGRAEAKRDQ
jgi:hypothetical protein